MNSEMKPHMPGRPSDAKRPTRSMAEYSGITLASPPEARDLAVVGPVVDHAGDKEEHGRDDPVREHVEHRARDPRRGHGRHAQQVKAHVADG